MKRKALSVIFLLTVLAIAAEQVSLHVIILSMDLTTAS